MVELVRQNLRKNKKIYNSIVKDLRKKLPSKISIDHVGSTAIPNMYGKNIIDILIGVDNYRQLDEIKKILENSNYISSKNNKDKNYQFLASTSKETKSGDIHIHLVKKETQRYSDFIILRNYLLKNKIEAKNYSNHKKELINNGINIREDYKKEKSKYVSELLVRARKGIENENK